MAALELFRQSYCACAVESAVLAGIIKASLWLDTKKLGRPGLLGKIWPLSPGFFFNSKNNCYIEFTATCNCVSGCFQVMSVCIVWSVKP